MSDTPAQASEALDGVASAGETAAPVAAPTEPMTGSVAVTGTLTVGGDVEITATYDDQDVAVELAVDQPAGPTCDKCGAPGPDAETLTWQYTGRGSPWTVVMTATRAGTHHVRFSTAEAEVAAVDFEVAPA